jgi:hypothetical protein
MLDVDTTIAVLRSPERKAIGTGLLLDISLFAATTHNPLPFVLLLSGEGREVA